jgi:hypothetical protein
MSFYGEHDDSNSPSIDRSAWKRAPPKSKSSGDAPRVEPMSNNSSLSPDEYLNLRTAYDHVCSDYLAIDDFRDKLLALLPLASGTGIFLLLSNESARQYLTAIGTFGFAVSLGLYFYELRGTQYCTHMIAAGKTLEMQLGIPGRFSTRPPQYVAGFISELVAAPVIYGAVLAAWTFVAIVFAPLGGTSAEQKPAMLLGLLVFVIVLVFARLIKLSPPQEQDLNIQMLCLMLEKLRYLATSPPVRNEIKLFQHRMLKLSQKKAGLAFRDFQDLSDIISKIEQ